MGSVKYCEGIRLTQFRSLLDCTGGTQRYSAAAPRLLYSNEAPSFNSEGEGSKCIAALAFTVIWNTERGHFI